MGTYCDAIRADLASGPLAKEARRSQLVPLKLTDDCSDGTLAQVATILGEAAVHDSAWFGSALSGGRGFDHTYCGPVRLCGRNVTLIV